MDCIIIFIVILKNLYYRTTATRREVTHLCTVFSASIDDKRLKRLRLLSTTECTYALELYLTNNNAFDMFVEEDVIKQLYKGEIVNTGVC